MRVLKSALIAIACTAWLLLGLVMVIGGAFNWFFFGVGYVGPVVILIRKMVRDRRAKCRQTAESAAPRVEQTRDD